MKQICFSEKFTFKMSFQDLIATFWSSFSFLHFLFNCFSFLFIRAIYVHHGKVEEYKRSTKNKNFSYIHNMDWITDISIFFYEHILAFIVTKNIYNFFFNWKYFLGIFLCFYKLFENVYLLYFDFQFFLLRGWLSHQSF